MEYGDKQLMKTDILNVLRFISTGFFQYKISRIILHFVLLVHLASTVITAYFFMYVLDKKQKLSYGEIFIGTFYLLFINATLLYKDQIVVNLKKEIPLWEIDSADETLYLRIKREAKLITVFTVVMFFTAMGGCFLHLISLSNDDKVFFMLRFAKDYWSGVEILYKTTYPFIAHLMIAHPLQLLYYTQHLKFQVLLSKQYLLNIDNCVPENLDDKKLFYSEEYQDVVKHRLIFCIKRYEDFVDLHRIKVKEVRRLIAGFGVGGGIIGINFIIIIFSGNLSSEWYLRMGMTSFAGFILIACCIWAGQSIETVCEDDVSVVFHICWYNFNKENKQLYLIFIAHLMKTRKIQFSENYSVNHKFGLQLLKTIYSIGSVVVHLVKTSGMIKIA